MSSYDECVRNELQRLTDGPLEDQRPPDWQISRFTVMCSDNAALVLSNAKSVLHAVDEAALKGWPAECEWPSVLPEWFVSQCSPRRTQDEAQKYLKRLQTLPWEDRVREQRQAKWALLNWVYWFKADHREWYWWDARVMNSNEIDLELESEDFPFAWDALDWLFRASGALQVDEQS
jgi:hypothetical protein